MAVALALPGFPVELVEPNCWVVGDATIIVGAIGGGLKAGAVAVCDAMLAPVCAKAVWFPGGPMITGPAVLAAGVACATLAAAAAFVTDWACSAAMESFCQ